MGSSHLYLPGVDKTKDKRGSLFPPPGKSSVDGVLRERTNDVANSVDTICHNLWKKV